MNDDALHRRPVRKHLRRIPVWLPSDQRVTYFITACCNKRRVLFQHARYVRIALKSLILTAERFDWNVWHICFMPDHVHFLTSPMREREQRISRLIQAWRSSSTQQLHKSGVEGTVWQREFFDRLLRSDESMAEKWQYVRENPVRTGLCQTADGYLFSGTPDEIIKKINEPFTA